MSHAAVPLAAAALAGRGRIPVATAMLGVAFAMLPDADVAGFHLEIAYGDTWGHRGASHSLVFAALAAAVATAAIRSQQRLWVFGFLFLSMASHGLLDALTNGGLGPALFWPWSDARHFAPVRPIAVSPIGSAFFSSRGVMVLASEALWIWLPALVVIGLSRRLRV